MKRYSCNNIEVEEETFDTPKESIVAYLLGEEDDGRPFCALTVYTHEPTYPKDEDLDRWLCGCADDLADLYSDDDDAGGCSDEQSAKELAARILAALGPVRDVLKAQAPYWWNITGQREYSAEEVAVIYAEGKDVKP